MSLRRHLCRERYRFRSFHARVLNSPEKPFEPRGRESRPHLRTRFGGPRMYLEPSKAARKLPRNLQVIFVQPSSSNDAVTDADRSFLSFPFFFLSFPSYSSSVHKYARITDGDCRYRWKTDYRYGDVVFRATDVIEDFYRAFVLSSRHRYLAETDRVDVRFRGEFAFFYSCLATGETKTRTQGRPPRAATFSLLQCSNQSHLLM